MMKKFMLLTFMAIFALAITSANGALVGHWEFDNASNVGEATVSDNLEAVGSAAYSSSGKVGGALALDGTGYLRVNSFGNVPADTPMGNEPFTTAAFIKTSVTADMAVISIGAQGTGNDYNLLSTGGTDTLAHYTWSADENMGDTGEVDMYDGGWHHVAVTYDGSLTTKLYLDGEMISEKTLSADLDIGNSQSYNKNFGIGARMKLRGSVQGGYYFNGLIDDVRIYDETLDLAGIAEIANQLALVAPDQITWLDEPVSLSVNNSVGAVTWSSVPSGAGITVTPDSGDPNIAVLEVSYDDLNTTMTPIVVTANVDGDDLSATIDVYDTACDAAREGLNLALDGDIDVDCDVDRGDLLELALKWLGSQGLTLGGELGVLDLTANDGENPVTSAAWADGDEYRLMFVSAATMDANSAPYAPYDDFLTAAAADAGIGGNWLCLTNDNRNFAVAENDHAVLRMDSAVIYPNLSAAGDMWTIHNYPDITENGDVYKGRIATKNLGGDLMCAYNGDGQNSELYAYWIYPIGNRGQPGSEIGDANAQNHFYALSEPLTVQCVSAGIYDLEDFAQVAADWDTPNNAPTTPQPRP